MKLIRMLPALLLAVTAGVARAQQIPGTEITQVLASRPQLESTLVRLDEASRSNVYSASVREDARRRAAMVRARLADGDFHVGDRIWLQVEGETSLTDTFTVMSGREVILPTVGAMALRGVLRYELTDYLTRQLARFLRDPKVRAGALIRVTIMGSVGRPGFYTTPVDITVDAVLMLAGGPAATADLEKIYIERGREVLYEGQTLSDIITQGTTIDALGIQAGDRFRVDALPVRSTNPVQRFQAINYLLALPFSVLAVAKLFGF